MSLKFSTLASIVGAMLVCASTANASLVYDSIRNNNGQGFGNTTNILTFGSAGNAQTKATRAGGVGWNGLANTYFSENVVGAIDRGAGKTSTHTFGSLSLTQASDITLFWNPAEIGNTVGQNNQVDLAVLNIYTNLGALFWTSGQSTTTDAGFTTTFFATTINNGVGGDGYGFGLDDAQALSLQTALNGVADFSLYRIGMFARNSLLDNGPDTWSIGSAPARPPQQVPEPSSLALFGASLLGLGFAGLRRRRR